MRNILIADESKTQNQKILIFAYIIIKNTTEELRIAKDLSNILKDYNSLHKTSIKEIHSNKISGKNLKGYQSLLDDMFNYLIGEVKKRNLKINFHVIHNDKIKYKNINIEKVLKGIIINTTNIKEKEVKHFLYSKFYINLCLLLHSFPINNDNIEAIKCDNIYNLVNTSLLRFLGFGRFFKINTSLISYLPKLIEILHNKIHITKKHNGLSKIEFVDSKKSLLIQVCDILSNFLLASIRYKYYDSQNMPIKNKYSAKYNFLNTYVDLSNLPLASLSLRYNTTLKEIEPTTIFDDIQGSI